MIIEIHFFSRFLAEGRSLISFGRKEELGFTNLSHNLQLLALAVLGFGDSPLNALDVLGVEFLGKSNVHQPGEVAFKTALPIAENSRGRQISIPERW
jgi:hypothetical protein